MTFGVTIKNRFHNLASILVPFAASGESEAHPPEANQTTPPKSQKNIEFLDTYDDEDRAVARVSQREAL
jgi:hypothetical protein